MFGGRKLVLAFSIKLFHHFQMEPENVHSSNFTKHVVLYNDKDFSIAIGDWEGNEDNRSVGMRWNEAYTGIGYPNAKGNPKWFIVENNVALPLLVWLLGRNEGKHDADIKNVIKRII